ncbi:hypothetical protein K505DRAFT_151491 [Melanomma pulvis-pyrius CBS 109.77]|uniref:Uncharacterized protein n=1 Tax=Melanomma pulvis-pyrius CBS 109.77 TaxID=1314802 RepID=A0A6A6WQ26_9PLEO|nr:hypothetical protein K505DRAFT_151491 [Melanomma pulvis-pyrius CBS 109.77]
MQIKFQNYMKQICRMCRSSPSLQAQGGNDLNEVQVCEGSDWESLQENLSRNFPASEGNVTDDQMRDWWHSNGKIFNWSGLATELKETIIQYCMCRPHSYGNYFYCLEGYRRLRSSAPGPCEIVGQLGPWTSLLGVSAEVRKITLQICFRGGWLYPQGLSIMSNVQHHFQKSIHRLERYYQIFERHSIPDANNRKTMKLASQYKYFPKIYRELNTYATFMHGIRKVFLGFDSWSSLHFFKVSTCNFDKYRPQKFITCDVFERLPYLNAIYIFLPTDGNFRNDPMIFGPKLFDNNRPCARSLHRLIYENAAKELAPYNGVHMKMFMDEYEEQRFLDLHAAAKSELKFTDEELKELWEECGGGVQLDPDSISTTKDERFEARPETLDGAGNITLTPYCKCEIPCLDAYQLAGRY